jgi:caffeoyl-CoA O-methyltransferase
LGRNIYIICHFIAELRVIAELRDAGRKPRGCKVENKLPSIVEKYIDDHTDDPSPSLSELIKETEEATGRSWWSIGKIEGKFLQMLVKISGARNAVEIGTFTGYSALIIAAALPEDGSLITCETNEKHAEIALRYFRKSGFARKIRLELRPALETLNRLAGSSADFVFIDADKPSYSLYFDQAMRILRSGGLILVDNVFWRNKIFKQPITNKNAKAIAAFNEKVRNEDRAEKIMLSIRDGVYLVRKK